MKICIIWFMISAGLLISCGQDDGGPTCENQVDLDPTLGWWPHQLGNEWMYYTFTPCGTIILVTRSITGLGLPVADNDSDSLETFLIFDDSCGACAKQRQYALTTDGLRLYELDPLVGVPSAMLIADFSLEVGQFLDSVIFVTEKTENTIIFFKSKGLSKGSWPLQGYFFGNNRGQEPYP